MRAAIALVVSTIAFIACGGAPEVSPVTTTARAASPIATSTGPADEIVAQVNGRPVWASCVAAQGAKLGRVADAKQKALDECIAFELLAQEAERRGFAEDIDVVDATRTAVVNRLVELGFEQKYKAPADLGERLDKWFRENEWRMHRPELRSSAYARIAGDTPEARRAARAIYDELANRTGLFVLDLQEAAKLPGLPTVEVKTVGISARDQLVAEYSKALFAIPDVGRVSPPTKTQWGWDVILWTGGLPPKETTRAQLEAEAFPEMRRSMFPIWVATIARDLGLKPEIDQAGVARLDEVGP